MKDQDASPSSRHGHGEDPWIDPLQPEAAGRKWFGLGRRGDAHAPPRDDAPSTTSKSNGAIRSSASQPLKAVASAKTLRTALSRELLPGELARVASIPSPAKPAPNGAPSTDSSHDLDDEDFVVDEAEIALQAQLAARDAEARRFEEEVAKNFRLRRWAVWLFFMTCLTTFIAGLRSGGQGGPGARPEDLLRDGAVYALCVMAILCAHELGHFLQSRRYGIPGYYPLFIPFPFGIFGTLGATVSTNHRKLPRHAILDIAVTGPLFGLLVTLPIAYYGALTSIPFPMNAQPGLSLSDPPILRWMILLTHPQLGPNDDVLINPALLAGWFGIYWTALNLVPIGQLDGGQIMAGLIGRRAEWVSKLTIVIAVVWMFYSLDLTFSTMLGLMAFMGIRSPEIEDEDKPPDLRRILLGWLLLAFLLIGFTPIPFRML
jgi:Zn-dependent protease